MVRHVSGGHQGIHGCVVCERLSPICMQDHLLKRWGEKGDEWQRTSAGECQGRGLVGDGREKGKNWHVERNVGGSEGKRRTDQAEERTGKKDGKNW